MPVPVCIETGACLDIGCTSKSLLQGNGVALLLFSAAKKVSLSRNRARSLLNDLNRPTARATDTSFVVGLSDSPLRVLHFPNQLPPRRSLQENAGPLSDALSALGQDPTQY